MAKLSTNREKSKIEEESQVAAQMNGIKSEDVRGNEILIKASMRLGSWETPRAE